MEEKDEVVTNQNQESEIIELSDNKPTIINQAVEAPTKPNKTKKHKKAREKREPIHKLAHFTLTLSVLAMIATLAVPLFFVFVLAYYLVLVLIIVATLFTLLFSYKFMRTFNNGTKLLEYSASLVEYLPYAFFAGLGLSLVSFVLYRFVKPQKRVAGTVMSIITFVICLAVCILYYVLDGKIAVSL